MSEKDGSQRRIYHNNQSRDIDLSQAFEERMDPIPVRTSTPPPPHIKWPIIYPEQLELVQTAIMPALPPSTPNPLLAETGRQRGKKLLDYALATAFPPNEPTRLAFPQLPDTPIPALDLMDLEATPPPMAATAQEEIQPQTPLSQSESSSRLRAIRLSRIKEA